MSASTLNILVIGSAWPASASGQMMQRLDSFLACGWQVTFSSPAVVGEHRIDLAARGIAEQVIAADDSNFDTFVAGLAPDVVLFDRFAMEERFAWRVELHCPDALRVLDAPYLQSLRDAREVLLRRRLTLGLDPNDFRELFATSGSDLYRQMAPTGLALREVAAIHRSDLSLIASDVEINLLVNGFGVPPDLLHWCPLMLQAPDTAPLPFAAREHIVSFVDFNQAESRDALLWMKHNIWPMIRRRLPEAQLHIHDAAGSAKAAALNESDGGFLVLDQADDVREVSAKARICLAPLRIGAGLKAGLADAMLAGTPSVTTPLGAEAMHGALPWPGLVSGTAEGLAEAAARLYSDEARWQQAQREARQVLDARYDKRWHGQALAERIEQTLAELADQRLYNFTGAMLRQQRHSRT